MLSRVFSTQHSALSSRPLRPGRQRLLVPAAVLSAVVALVVRGHELLADRAEDLLVRLRGQIDEMLATKGAIRPEAVTKWLYKEVLHADLDDPYLGLGETLFASYPFKDDKGR